MQFFQKILLGIYSLFQKTGLLETSWFKNFFLACYFFYKKFLEDPFWGLLKNRKDLFERGHILDIGANIGYTSIVFSQAATPGFKVYSFEPDISNFLTLNEVIKNHKAIGKIIPIQAAVGSTNKTIEFWHNRKHSGDHRVLTQDYKKNGVDLSEVSVVEMWCIDNFVEFEKIESAVKFIKIDVQGYELPVCQGMERTLMANPDAVVALEYAPIHMSELGFEPKELLKLFQDKSYFIYILHRKGNFEPAQNEVIDKMVKKQGYVDLLCSRKNLF